MGRSQKLAAAQRTGSGRLPDFLIIGAQKGGTSYFYRLLVTHPMVRAAAAKEVHYFDWNAYKGLEWYRGCFPKRPQKVICGEASPSYLWHEYAPERIGKTLPDVKLIALLRNPTSRAYSHYLMEVRNSKETRSFEESIETEISGQETPAYLKRGHYAEQLARYSSFFQDGRILVLKSEDFFGSPEACVQEAQGFLGLNVIPVPDRERKPRSSGTRMGTEIKERLSAYFQPYNERLYELLGRDLGW